MSDEPDFQHAIVHFKSIMQTILVTNINHEPCSKIGATFIGIKTNVSGKLKMHTYVLLTPFVVQENELPYSHTHSNVYLKDMVFNTTVTIFKWLFKKMNDTHGMVMLECASDIWTIASNFLLQLTNNCAEPKLWLTQDFETWFENKQFNNVFTITIPNPYLYMVPFPMNPIIIHTSPKSNHFVDVQLKSVWN